MMALMLGFSLTMHAGIIDMGGTAAQIDTIDSYQIGPGTVYTKIQMNKGGKVRNLYIMQVDLTNPNNKIETVVANDALGPAESLAHMYTRLDAPGHRMLGGTNCTPYAMQVHVDASEAGRQIYDGTQGHPVYAVVSNSVFVCSNSGYDRGYADADHDHESGYLAIDESKKAYVNDFETSGSVTIGGNTYEISEANRPRKYEDSRIDVYNHLVGTTPVRSQCQEIVFTVAKWQMNTPLTCTVVSTNTTGGTRLALGQGAVQGLNNCAAQLGEMKAGDTFTLQVNAVARDGSVSAPLETLAGGFALNMFDGELTVRNFDEEYSSMDYPRPLMATNAEGNVVWLVECEKPGISTAEGCYILKSMGAVSVASFDGGGSAQMNVFGKYMFSTTESTPRSLPVGMWVVSTAADDSIAGRMEFVAPLASIPAYASYTPQVRAWNAAGVLLSHDFKTITLSCEPASLGTISHDGLTFTANPVNATGKLIATSGNTTCETPIEIKDGEVHILLDSILLGNVDYNIEVQAVAEGLTLPMSPKALTWTVDNENVATVDNGLLHGVGNGRAVATGTLGQFTDQLIVNVQLASAHQLRTNGSRVSGNSPYAIDTTFSFTSARGAALEFPLDQVLYGCPDSILFLVHSTVGIKSLRMEYLANNANVEEAQAISDFQQSGEEFVFPAALADMLNVSNRAIWPVTLQKIKITFDGAKAKTQYNLQLRDIILCYNSWDAASALLKTIAPTDNSVRKIMVDGQVYIICGEKIFDANGKSIR